MDLIIERKGAKPKLTITPTQTRVKFPVELTDAECLSLLSFFNKIVDDLHPVINTTRGYYLSKKDEIRMWVGKERTTVKVYKLNDSSSDKV